VETEQAGLLLDVAQGSPAAKRKLEVLREQLFGATAEAEESEKTLVAVRERLADLGKSKQLAEQRAMQRKREEIGTEALAKAENIDAMFSELKNLLVDWRQDATEIYGLTLSLGEHYGKTPKHQIYSAITAHLNDYAIVPMYTWDRPSFVTTLSEFSKRYATKKMKVA